MDIPQKHVALLKNCNFLSIIASCLLMADIQNFFTKYIVTAATDSSIGIELILLFCKVLVSAVLLQEYFILLV